MIQQKQNVTDNAPKPMQLNMLGKVHIVGPETMTAHVQLAFLLERL